MSIVRTCVRIAAVMALQGKTWAEARVYDSRNTPLDEAMRQEQRAFLTVFTDMDKRFVTGFDLNCATRALHLVIEMGIAGPVPAQEGDQPTVAIPATDRAIERAVDMLEAQVLRALFHDPLNAWGGLLRELMVEVKDVDGARGGEAERGVRWGARSIDIECDVIADPLPGVVIDDDHPVLRFIEMAKDTENVELMAAAKLVEDHITGAELPGWQQAQALLGLTDGAVRGIGIDPPYASPTTGTTIELIGLTPEDIRTTEDNAGERVTDLGLEEDPTTVIPAEEENRV